MESKNTGDCSNCRYDTELYCMYGEATGKRCIDGEGWEEKEHIPTYTKELPEESGWYPAIRDDGTKKDVVSFEKERGLFFHSKGNWGHNDLEFFSRWSIGPKVEFPEE